MYKRFTLVILLAVVLLAVVFPIQAVQEEDDPITRIDDLIDGWVENDEFSGSVLIAQDGEILLSKGYGLANREWDIPNAADTKFNIGSMNTVFTAMAILILQEQGLLTVDDSICQYIEECPDAWQDITIHHLLTHTSGILDMQPDDNPECMLAQGARPAQLIAFVKDLPLVFAPGDGIDQYPQPGAPDYIILGHIIEQVSGGSYGRFLVSNMFEPLGMEDTGYDDSSVRIIEHHAEGYISSYRKAAYPHPCVAGALHSTVEDIYKWQQALFDGQVVSQESWDTMIELAAPLSHEGWYLGYGVFIDQDTDHPYINHSGGINGFFSVMRYYTTDNVTVIILTNRPDSIVWRQRDPFGPILFEE
jgi:CubicO group peptidase (beta-lactamase class C family)